jgi:hypothetical protein
MAREIQNSKLQIQSKFQYSNSKPLGGRGADRLSAGKFLRQRAILRTAAFDLWILILDIALDLEL